MGSSRIPVLRFLLTLTAWTLAAFALLANASVEASVVVPFSRWQAVLAERYVLGGPLTVGVAPSCSGLDVMGMCLAATLSYPVVWRRRLFGAGIGIGLLLTLNVLRISVLAAAADTPWFSTLHLFVWPGVLVLATAAWVAIWIRAAERHDVPIPEPRFLMWTAAMLAAYVAAVPVLTDFSVLDRAAQDIAALAAAVLSALGIEATITGNLLRARGHAYLITPECITTPLMALYMAALFAFPIGWRRRTAGVAAFVPVFTALAVVRLLTVALPPMILGTELIFTHGFHQWLVGIVAVAVASIWAGHRRMRLVSVVALATGSAAAAVWMFGVSYAGVLASLLQALHLAAPAGLTPTSGDGDVQGAMLLLPIYQIVLFFTLSAIVRAHVTTRGWLAAAVILALSQAAFLGAAGWMEALGEVALPAVFLRGWAVGVPIVLIAGLCAASRRRSAAGLPTIVDGPVPREGEAVT